MTLRPRTRVLLLALSIFVVLAALIWTLVVRYGTTPATPIALPSNNEAVAPGNIKAASPTATPNATPATSAPDSTPSNTPTPDANATPARNSTPAGAVSNSSSPSSIAAPESAKNLLIPVAGVRAEQLHDTFTDARSEGRIHDAIDIPAPRDTPVLAANDGAIVKLFQSKPGGLTIYQLGTDNHTIFYYAHLNRYADGLAEGQRVKRGETIAYVGDTGNAVPGNYHLHFSISVVSDPKRYWEGTNINPYPLLGGK